MTTVEAHVKQSRTDKAFELIYQSLAATSKYLPISIPLTLHRCIYLSSAQFP